MAGYRDEYGNWIEDDVSIDPDTGLPVDITSPGGPPPGGYDHRDPNAGYVNPETGQYDPGNYWPSGFDPGGDGTPITDILDEWTKKGDDVVDTSSCFPAETLIAVPGGTVAIDSLRVGDEVVTDPSGQVGTISATMAHPVAPLFAIAYDGGSLRATAEHPIFLVGRGFVPVRDLQVGDVARRIDGAEVRIVSIASSHAEPVFNLTIEPSHTYFANGILVHNKQTTGGGGGGFTGTFSPPARQAYPSLPTVPNAPAPNLPAFRQAPAFSYDPYRAADPFTPNTFTAPSPSAINTDPSYQWRKGQGEDSLQRWAAARGTLNDSGTAKALLEYGGNAASQEYSNIWNRDYNAFNTNEGNRFNAYRENEGNRARTYDTNRAGAVQQYNTNYQTQYVDPYKAAYQTAIDTWIPEQETWRAKNQRADLGYTTQTGNVRLDNTQNYDNAWNRFLQGWNQWKHGPIDDQTFGYGMA